MKKNISFVFVCLVIIFSFSTANAEYLGSMEPISSGPLWKVSMGLGYQYYSDKIEIGSTSYTLNQNQVFLELSATVRNIEGYIRVGGADLQVNDIFNPNIYGGKSDFKDDTFKAFLTAGGRGSIPISPNFSINPFLQATFYPDYNDHADGTIGGQPVRQELEFSFYKVETGLLLQANLKPVTFYIGPIFYWIRGDVNNTEFEEKGNIGGAAGIKLSLGGNFSIGIEAQYRQEFSAGGMINYSF